jgi:FixJ family two-component response regulator
MSGRPTVYLVDDDASFLAAMSRLLRASGFETASYGAAGELLATLGPESRGCVVADLSMPGIDGLELQAILARTGILLPVVFLTGHGDIPSTVRAMREGAVDFLEKLAPRDRLLGAIRDALARDEAEHLRRLRVRELQRRFEKLTSRELQVLRQVVGGRMNKQIAADLGISERTVKMHRTAITTKVGVHSSAQLATLAREAGLFADAARQGQAGRRDATLAD